MYASITTTDPDPHVSARVVDSEAGEVQLTVGDGGGMTAGTAAGAMFACPAPAWANEPTDWFMGTAEHHRYAQRPLRVCAWLEQLDELDVTDGVVSFVRHQPTIVVQFDSPDENAFDSESLPVEQFRDGWLPPLPATITVERVALARDAVAELLVILDGSVTA